MVEHQPESKASFLELGGPVQLSYETLRAEVVGEMAGQITTDSWWHRWERFGLLGLFNQDQDLHAPIDGVIRSLRIQGATQTTESWRTTLDVYRSLIDKSLEDILPRRVGDELTASSCGDLCESIFTASTETSNDRQPSYAIALSG